MFDWIDAIFAIPDGISEWRDHPKAKKKDTGEPKPPPSDRQPHDPPGNDDSSPFIR